MNMNLHSIHGHNAHGMNSPTSSPTANDFPSHSMSSLSHSHHTHHAHVQHSHPHPLSRQHSFHQQQQQQQHHGNGMSGRSSERSSTSSTPLQSSPSPASMSTSISMDMDLYDDGPCDPPVCSRGAVKRQRMDDSLDGPGQAGPGSLNLSIGVNANGHGSPSAPDSLGLISAVSSPGAGPGGGANNLVVPKKGNMRARSDSAPLGYVSSGGGLSGLHSHTWGATHGHGMGGGHGLGAANGHNPMNLNGHSIAGRPRSGSGMMPPRIAIPSIGGMGRPGVNAGHSSAATSGPPTPMLSMSHVHAHQVGR